MEQILVSGTNFMVAVIIAPTTADNEIVWTTTIRPHFYRRIAHVDIVALRREYDRCGYTGELKLVLKQGYTDDYPCSAYINSPSFFARLDDKEKEEFIKRVNASKIPQILKKN